MTPDLVDETEPSLPPFGDLFEKVGQTSARSPFYDLESHFWARDKQRDLLRVADGWWALAWLAVPYNEQLAVRLGDRARKFEARAERLTYSAWAISSATTLASTGVVLLSALLLFPLLKGKA